MNDEKKMNPNQHRNNFHSMQSPQTQQQELGSLSQQVNNGIEEEFIATESLVTAVLRNNITRSPELDQQLEQEFQRESILQRTMKFQLKKLRQELSGSVRSLPFNTQQSIVIKPNEENAGTTAYIRKGETRLSPNHLRYVNGLNQNMMNSGSFSVFKSEVFSDKNRIGSPQSMISHKDKSPESTQKKNNMYQVQISPEQFHQNKNDSVVLREMEVNFNSIEEQQQISSEFLSPCFPKQKQQSQEHQDLQNQYNQGLNVKQVSNNQNIQTNLKGCLSQEAALNQQNNNNNLESKNNDQKQTQVIALNNSQSDKNIHEQVLEIKLQRDQKKNFETQSAAFSSIQSPQQFSSQQDSKAIDGNAIHMSTQTDEIAAPFSRDRNNHLDTFQFQNSQDNIQHNNQNNINNLSSKAGTYFNYFPGQIFRKFQEDRYVPAINLSKLKRNQHSPDKSGDTIQVATSPKSPVVSTIQEQEESPLRNLDSNDLARPKTGADSSKFIQNLRGPLFYENYAQNHSLIKNKIWIKLENKKQGAGSAKSKRSKDQNNLLLRQNMKLNRENQELLQRLQNSQMPTQKKEKFNLLQGTHLLEFKQINQTDTYLNSSPSPPSKSQQSQNNQIYGLRTSQPPPISKSKPIQELSAEKFEENLKLIKDFKKIQTDINAQGNPFIQPEGDIKTETKQQKRKFPALALSPNARGTHIEKNFDFLMSQTTQNFTNHDSSTNQKDRSLLQDRSFLTKSRESSMTNPIKQSRMNFRPKQIQKEGDFDNQDQESYLPPKPQTSPEIKKRARIKNNQIYKSHDNTVQDYLLMTNQDKDQFDVVEAAWPPRPQEAMNSSEADQIEHVKFVKHNQEFGNDFVYFQSGFAPQPQNPLVRIPNYGEPEPPVGFVDFAQSSPRNIGSQGGSRTHVLTSASNLKQKKDLFTLGNVQSDQKTDQLVRVSDTFKPDSQHKRSVSHHPHRQEKHYQNRQLETSFQNRAPARQANNENKHNNQLQPINVIPQVKQTKVRSSTVKQQHKIGQRELMKLYEFKQIIDAYCQKGLFEPFQGIKANQKAVN